MPTLPIARPVSTDEVESLLRRSDEHLAASRGALLLTIALLAQCAPLRAPLLPSVTVPPGAVESPARPRSA